MNTLSPTWLAVAAMCCACGAKPAPYAGRPPAEPAVVAEHQPDGCPGAPEPRVADEKRPRQPSVLFRKPPAVPAPAERPALPRAWLAIATQHWDAGVISAALPEEMRRDFDEREALLAAHAKAYRRADALKRQASACADAQPWCRCVQAAYDKRAEGLKRGVAEVAAVDRRLLAAARASNQRAAALVSAVLLTEQALDSDDPEAMWPQAEQRFEVSVAGDHQDALAWQAHYQRAVAELDATRQQRHFAALLERTSNIAQRAEILFRIAELQDTPDKRATAFGRAAETAEAAPEARIFWGAARVSHVRALYEMGKMADVIVLGADTLRSLDRAHGDRGLEEILERVMASALPLAPPHIFIGGSEIRVPESSLSEIAYMMAEDFLAAGHASAAIAMLEEILSEAPRWVHARRSAAALARLYARAGKKDDAERWRQREREAFNPDSPWAKRLRTLNEKHGWPDDAKLEAALSGQPALVPP